MITSKEVMAMTPAELDTHLEKVASEFVYQGLPDNCSRQEQVEDLRSFMRAEEA